MWLDAPGVLAVSISKMINSEEFFSHVLKTCEERKFIKDQLHLFRQMK